MKKIKTVVLDADNVILKKISPKIISLLQEFSGRPEEEIKSIRKKYWGLTKIGAITEEENWLGAKDKENYKEGIFGELKISKEKYAQFIKRLRETYELNDGALEFLKELKYKDYNLYLFSNSSYETIERAYLHFKLNKYFTFAFFSHKLKAVKPDSKAFDILINKTHLIPDETLFVDDKERNRIVAKTLQFQTFLFREQKDFKKILRILDGQMHE